MLCSRISLFKFHQADTSLKVDQSSKVEKENKHQQPSLQPSPPPVSPQRGTIRHQSMLQPRRRHQNRRPSELSRRHTTAVNLASVTAGTYDISSLDQRDIRERGISVWQLSPAATSSLTPNATVAATNAPPVVMSSHMQATRLAAVTGHQTGVEEITYAKVTIGPRNAVLPWKPMELARRLDIFNANDFGLCAKMVRALFISLVSKRSIYSMQQMTTVSHIHVSKSIGLVVFHFFCYLGFTIFVLINANFSGICRLAFVLY